MLPAHRARVHDVPSVAFTSVFGKAAGGLDPPFFLHPEEKERGQKDPKDRAPKTKFQPTKPTHIGLLFSGLP